MLAADTTSNPNTAIYIVLPAATLVATVVAALIAAFPWWRRHQKKQEARDQVSERLNAAANAVLGCPANPNTGVGATVGLVTTINDLTASVGRMNGTGKTLVQMAEEGLQVSMTTRSLLDRHTQQDDERFKELGELIRGGAQK